MATAEGNEVVVEHGHRGHSLNHGDGPRQHASIMTPTRFHHRGIAVDIDRGLLAQQGGHGLEGHTKIDVGTVANAALYAATTIGGDGDGTGSVGGEIVVLLAATLTDALEAHTIVEALNGIDAKHGCAQIGMEFAKSGLAKPHGTAAHHAGDDTTDGVALGYDGLDEGSHCFGDLRVGTTHGIGLDKRKVELSIGSAYGNGAYLRGIGRDADAKLAQSQFGNGTTHTTRDGLTGRRTAAATMVTHTVFLEIGEVGMARAKELAQIVVV